MAHIIGLLLPETPGLDNGGIDAQADQVIAYRECPALAQGQIVFTAAPLIRVALDNHPAVLPFPEERGGLFAFACLLGIHL